MKIITIYELLGKVKDEPDRSIYVKYFDRVNKKEDVMWACKENIIYKLNQLIIELNDKVEVLEEKKTPEKLNLDTDELRGKETPRAIDYLIESKINQVIDYLKSKGE